MTNPGIWLPPACWNFIRRFFDCAVPKLKNVVMPDVSLILHLHHPYHPARFSYQDWQPELQGDLLATRESLLKATDTLFDPLSAMLGQALEINEEMGLGLTLSGPLLAQWKQWAPGSLETWQKVWKSSHIEVLPQAERYTPEVLWDRDAWLRSLQEYRENVSLSGATLSPVNWNPGYLFIRYLAWPLQDTGIQGCVVDGDSFGWGGSMANRVSRVPFQHSFKMLTRNSWWSRHIENMVGLEHGPLTEARNFLSGLAACKDSPVVLSVDMNHWLSRPGLLSAGISFLKILLEKGQDMGINWISPGQVLAKHESVADWTPTDWVVLPSQRGLLNDRFHQPVASEVMNTWKIMTEKGIHLPSHLIDSELLSTLDHPNHWISAELGKAGQVYSRLMKQLAVIQDQEQA